MGFLALLPVVLAAAPAAAAPAPAAVEATVVARESRWEDGLIVTDTRLRVDRVLRGQVPAEIVVTHLGGRVGDLAQIVSDEPTMPRGPTVALELRPGGPAWKLAGVLERVGARDASSTYVRATNKDPDPPCEGETKEVFWPVETVHWAIDSAGSADAPFEAVLAATQASFQTWEDLSCAYLDFAFDGEIDDAPIGHVPGGENHNVVKWIESGWQGEPAAQAITVTTLGCTSGRLLDADILVNGTNFEFTTTPASGQGKADVQNVLTHEVGHFAGFAHNPDPESTMYFQAGPDETKKRDLTDDDAQGLCDVYPLGSEPGTEEPEGCGCVVAGRRSPPGTGWGALALLLVGLARWTTRARRPGA